MWTGDYPDWESARADCRPTPIADQVSAYERAFLAVRAGRARYERDGILKHDLLLDWPLLTAFTEAREGGKRRLVVLDVGGALASTFWQHRPWLESFHEVRWNVVERPEIVAAGRRLIDDPRVRFFDSIPAALTEGPPDVAIGAGLLPTVADPFGMAEQIAATGARRVFLDRISVMTGRAATSAHGRSCRAGFMNRNPPSGSSTPRF